MVISCLTAHIHCLMREYAHIVPATPNCIKSQSRGRASGTQSQLLSGNQSALVKMQSKWWKFIFAQNSLRISHTKKQAMRGVRITQDT